MNVTSILIQGDGNESYIKHFQIEYRKKLASNEWGEWQYVKKDGDVETFDGVRNATEIRQVLMMWRLWRCESLENIER